MVKEAISLAWDLMAALGTFTVFLGSVAYVCGYFT